MERVRKSNERGHVDHGWLDARHTFSFGRYHDPDQMGFRALRVMNEDRVAPGEGFGMHGHRDMEIVTVVLDGVLEHRDSMGHTAKLGVGEVQYMSAGSGIRHSEYNPSPEKPVHLYQIWIEPNQHGLSPRYFQDRFPAGEKGEPWTLLAGPSGSGALFEIRQDARLWRGILAAGARTERPLEPGRGGWLQVLRGSLRTAAGAVLAAGDGLAVEGVSQSGFEATSDAEVLWFDLA